MERDEYVSESLSREDAQIVRAALALLAEDVREQERDRSVLGVHEVGVLRDESAPALRGQARQVIGRALELAGELDEAHGLAGVPEGQWPACLRPYMV